MRNLYPQLKIQRFRAIILLLCLQAFHSYAQENISPLIVGSSICESINSETDKGLLTAGLNIVQARRTYELAVIIDDEEGINGAEFVHKIFLNKKNSSDDYCITNYSFRPYIVYNLVYQRAVSQQQKDNNLIIYGSDYYSVLSIEKPEKVTTIKHYIGIGVERDIFSHLFINASAFTGIHLGKNNNNNKIDPTKAQHQENAYSWNVKFGFGYRF